MPLLRMILLVLCLSALGFILGSYLRKCLVERWRTAAHEAGHAIVAWLSPFVGEIELVEIDTVWPWTSGRIKYSWNGRFPPIPAKLWDQMALKLAGMAGEIAGANRAASRGNCPDFNGALRIAEQLSRGGPENGCPWDILDQPGRIDFEKVFGCSEQRLIDILNLGYRRARLLIQDNRPTFDKLRRRLFWKKRLSGADLAAILGSRPWAFK